jgi:hypothetical protein
MSEADIVERVAQAISPALVDPNHGDWPYWCRLARVAIRAMRVPTDAMVEEGFREIKPDNLPADRGDARAAWQAMIRAALDPRRPFTRADYDAAPVDGTRYKG